LSASTRAPNSAAIGSLRPRAGELDDYFASLA